MNRDEKIVKVLKGVLPIMSILTVFVFVMLINKKSYALFTKHIDTDITIHIETADELPKSEIGTDVVKDTLVPYSESSKKDFPGGLVAVNTNGGLYNETESSEQVREYRYSGPSVNNYIYFNCEKNTTYQTASTNCEIWRIIGVFKDESGKEHLKIVRNEKLSGIFPEIFEAEGTTYNIKSSSDAIAYWNKKVSGTSNNDWATAGLQYWLNTSADTTGQRGYLSYLKGNSESMIEKIKYYLGTVTYNSDKSSVGIWDTPNEAYKNERAIEGCEGGVGPTTNSNKSSVEGNESCRVWAGNQATWEEGKVALMYPSDYGFSTESSNWEKQLKDFDTIQSSSWINSMPSNGTVLLAPSSLDSSDFATLGSTGKMGSRDVDDNNVNLTSGVRPSITLISKIKIRQGDGSSSTPYYLEIS